MNSAFGYIYNDDLNKAISFMACVDSVDFTIFVSDEGGKYIENDGQMYLIFSHSAMSCDANSPND